ncbi:MAG: hypothetical protein L7U54_03720 [Flavobacteriaceae bacterium]|nr:hypothetical protein [Flavobacteriaceae bacterium]
MDTLKLNRLQWSIIAVCFFCNMLDGMDVLIISFTAPVIATQWKIVFLQDFLPKKFPIAKSTQR